MSNKWAASLSLLPFLAGSASAQTGNQPSLPQLLNDGYEIVASAAYDEENSEMQLIVSKRRSFYFCRVRGTQSACYEMEE